MFRQGSFVIDQNATPESIARKRAEIAALMPNFGSARYVGEGLGQLFTGIAMGQQRRKLDKAETAGRQSAQERFNAILGGGIQGRAQPGSLSVLGPMPAPDPNSPHALGNDAMAALGRAPIATKADPASIRQGLIARGLPEHIADGFVMNMKDESGLNPGINEIAPLVPGSRGGFGLYQLTGPRRVAYERFAQERGVPFDDVDAQLDFLMMELQGPEAAAASRIMAAPDAGSAAAAIVTDFLRPAPEHRDRRVAEYTGGGGVVSDAMNSPQMTAATVPMDALVGILSDPWATPEQRQMAQTMLDQQTQMNDPAYRMGLRADELAIQKAERELAQMDQPQTPEQLRERQALAVAGGLQPGTPEYQSFILTGNMPGETGNVPADFRSLQLRAEAAGLQPGTPEYQSFMQQGAGGGAPAAFVALDMQAQAAGFEPGTPEYREFMATRGAGLQAQARVEGEAAGEAVTGLGGAVAKAQRAIDLIDEISNDPALPSITGMVQGNIPAGTPLIGGGQPGIDLNAKILQLQGTAFLEAFESLKGGGAITEIEGTKAEQAIARLQRAQSADAYKAALQDLRDVIENGKIRAQERAARASGDGGTSTGGKTRYRFNPETNALEIVQ